MERVDKSALFSRIKKVALNFLWYFLLGIPCGLFVLQQSVSVQQYCNKKLIMRLQEEWGVVIRCERSSCSFLTLSLHCYDGSVQARTSKDFSWTFSSCGISLSLLDLLFKKKAALNVFLKDVRASSVVRDGKLSLVSHLEDIVKDKELAFPVVPEVIQFESIALSIVGEQRMTSAFVSYDGMIRLYKQKKQGWGISTKKGSLSLDLAKKKSVVNLSNLTLCVDVAFDDSLFDMLFSCRAGSIGLSRLVSITGRYAQGSFDMNVQSDDNAIQGFWRGNMERHNFYLSMPLSELRNMPLSLPQSLFDSYVDHSDLLIEGSGGRAQGECHARARAAVFYQGDVFLEGRCLFDSAKKEVTGEIKNKKEVALWKTRAVRTGDHEWSIPCEQGIASWSYRPQVGFFMKTNSCLIDQVTGQKHQLQASLMINNDGAHAECFSDKHFSAGIDISFFPFTHCVSVWGKDGSNLLYSLACQNDERKTLRGVINYELCNFLWGDEVSQYCTGHNACFDISLRQDKKPFFGHMALKSGSFYFPENRTLIKQCSSSFSLDPDLCMLSLRKGHITFGKGLVNIPYAYCQFSSSFGIDYFYMPVEVQDLFWNWKQNAYGIAYGHLLFSKKKLDPLHYAGALIARKSLMKEGALQSFSAPLEGSLHANKNKNFINAQGVCSFITESPIILNTPAVRASIGCDVKIYHPSTQSPYISGMILLEGGSVSLLRSNLIIERGYIQFFAHAMQDPMIDVVARSRVHKYNIAVHVTGSLKNPTVFLESTPALTEEQIVSLLLSGSDHTTLQTDLPAMLLYNINAIITGKAKSAKREGFTLFDQLLKPFQYVQISPDFTNQSGRGGIKGIVSIDVNEQLSAQITKNFNLQEDFSFFVQYMLNDDVACKVIKDQRGDIGSEVEVRLKL